MLLGALQVTPLNKRRYKTRCSSGDPWTKSSSHAFCLSIDTEWRVHAERHPQWCYKRWSEEFKTEVVKLLCSCFRTALIHYAVVYCVLTALCLLLSWPVRGGILCKLWKAITDYRQKPAWGLNGDNHSEKSGRVSQQLSVLLLTSVFIGARLFGENAACCHVYGAAFQPHETLFDRVMSGVFLSFWKQGFWN